MIKKLNFVLFVLMLPLLFLGNTYAKEKVSIEFKNEYFYDADGKFLTEKAKDSIIALMDYHGYPVFEGIRDKMFVTDYGTGKFSEVGISGIVFENNQTNMYFLLDFFLLPNQMVPEHWHPDGKTSAAKREGWLVRWGKAYIGGVGEDNLENFPSLTIPKIHLNGKVNVKNITEAFPGSFTNLKQVLSKHWMVAGKQGVIITEVANFSDSAASIRTDPKMN